MTREEFQKFYKKELNDFKSDLISDKEKTKRYLRDQLKEVGYDELVRAKEESIDIKKN